MSEKVFIVGAFQEIIDLAEVCGYEIIGLIDQDSVQSQYDYPVLCNDDGIMKTIDRLQGATAVLTPDSPEIRMRLHALYSAFGFSFASLISPAAKVATSATLGVGVILHWNSHVSAGCHIGRFVRINTAANVMHDSAIGEFTTIAPNAVILGRVAIGQGCYIGANSTILPNLVIGDQSVVGAGAVVTKDVPPQTVVAGNPARVIRRINYE